MEDASNRQTPMPATFLADDPDPIGPIDVGFGMDTSFDPWDIPNNQFEPAPVDRHITDADATGADQSGTGATGDRFSTGPDRHII